MDGTVRVVVTPKAVNQGVDTPITWLTVMVLW